MTRVGVDARAAGGAVGARAGLRRRRRSGGWSGRPGRSGGSRARPWRRGGRSGRGRCGRGGGSGAAASGSPGGGRAGRTGCRHRVPFGGRCAEPMRAADICHKSRTRPVMAAFSTRPSVRSPGVGTALGRRDESDARTGPRHSPAACRPAAPRAWTARGCVRGGWHACAMTDRQFGFRTRALHAGAGPDPTTGARAVPIYQSTSFVFEDTADAANLFALQKYGVIYSRIGNPTVAALEERLASLEGGPRAPWRRAAARRPSSSPSRRSPGPGDHVVAGASLYGGTITQLDVTMRRFGVDTTFVRGDGPGRLRRRDHRQDPLRLHGGREQPGRRGGRHRGPGRGGPRRRHPAGRGRDDGDARTCAGPSSTARTSSSTPRPSSSAGTARPSAASSSTPAPSRGTTASSPP